MTMSPRAGLKSGVSVGFGLLAVAACSSAPERSSPRATEDPAAVESAAVRAPPLVETEKDFESPAARRAAQRPGGPPGMVPFRGGPEVAATAVCANPQLTYFGGPLLQSPVVVAVFWTNTVNATLQANIGQFYADVTQSSYWSWLHEYDSVGLTPGHQPGHPPGHLRRRLHHRAAQVRARAATTASSPTHDLQTELTRQINLGVLPAPTLDCTGNVNTIYMIDFPPNISPHRPAGGRHVVRQRRVLRVPQHRHVRREQAPRSSTAR